MGGDSGRFTEKERRQEVTKKKEKDWGKASSNLIGLVSHRLLYRSSLYLFFLFVLFLLFLCFFSLPDEQLQNFLGPQADACFRVTPVPNVGKSSALLMSGAWNKTNHNIIQDRRK